MAVEIERKYRVDNRRSPIGALSLTSARSGDAAAGAAAECTSRGGGTAAAGAAAEGTSDGGGDGDG